MRAGFGMDRDAVATGLGEGLKIRIGGGDHQMAIEEGLAVGRSALITSGPKEMFGTK